ncbi:MULTISPECIES: ABC transporter ATP-binding protein [Bifidobacterium]|jgi:putative ABC transport system ATP-binding protein|uniref:ABC transporter ATP-binding protein n=1 Tax=Bifidobacterium tibiigranuli TaxID=2172043 RepID=A0A5N6RYN7_9BIFI|nr:ABC transporter ATP-binding protein [Bifidobacterium tibiigranuli]KAE8127221.1 ABC transporter ATP-binding protein [Bifidobacterium tibiigranuli]KAE8127556.1 ABC transporter ATP-binding protein [Bifidobacterium tibiigranuli]MCI1211351.1 ABC transporter ATP-binding protein [Bifidobacterium tibiigranuli]MCI1220679.1 ABC transporter ATP-binding protein [Bifidobacterium tibiigranuli]MCI1232227.1 ABC transporter ATP-binding protein [Bifidobacterium tibiigranuli]
MSDDALRNNARYGDMADGMTDGMVMAEGLAKSFVSGDGTSTTVFSDVSFSASGGMTAITGPSGCGKSTLLYCLSGLESPSRGSVRVLGERLDGKDQRGLALFRRSHIGFVFQAYNLVPSMTVRDNILLPLTLARRKADRERLSALMEKFRLSGHEGAIAGSLSGGEQQRVALVRTLVADPDVVFADEPTGALDRSTGQLVFDELRGFSHRPGKCVIVVTHDPGLAQQCDAVYTMRDGKLAAPGRGEL